MYERKKFWKGEATNEIMLREIDYYIADRGRKYVSLVVNWSCWQLVKDLRKRVDGDGLSAC